MVVPPISAAMTVKDTLRSQVRRARRQYVASLSIDARSQLHTNLAKQVCQHLPTGITLGSYVPFSEEIDPREIELGAARAGLRLCYPWFAARDAPMIFRRADAVSPGPFGFLQPSPDCPQMVPDVILLPLIAADTEGNRIGQGKGHYDRFLAGHRASTIGLAYDVQIVASISRDPWDIALDAIATPTRWIEIGG